MFRSPWRPQCLPLVICTEQRINYCYEGSFGGYLITITSRNIRSWQNRDPWSSPLALGLTFQETSVWYSATYSILCQRVTRDLRELWERNGRSILGVNIVMVTSQKWRACAAWRGSMASTPGKDPGWELHEDIQGVNGIIETNSLPWTFL